VNAFQRRILLAASCAALGFVLSTMSARAASPTPTPASTASPSPAATASVSAADQKVLDRAKSWYGMLQTGKIDRTQLTKDMNDAMTPAKVEAISQQLKALGSPTTFTQKDTSVVGAYSVYHYNVTVSGGTLVMTFALDKSGQIAGINLRPAGATP